MSIDQYGIHIGILYFRFYGIILMLGTVAGAYLASREARRRGKDETILWDALLWLIIGGVLGARLWHVLTPPPSMVARGITTSYYFTHPLDAIAIWRGGLGIPGAVIGGLLAFYIFSRIKKINFAIWVDIFTPGLALGQAIGRWGNYVNQELYGAPDNELPWSIFIKPSNRLPEYADQAYYHPIFLYESLWNLASVFFLLWLARRYAGRLKPGDIFLTYLITYPTIRFLLEFLRLDSSKVAGINANQTLMLVVGLASAGTLIYRYQFAKKPK